MHLRDERAGGVDHVEVACKGTLAHWARRRGRETRVPPWGHLFHFIDEDHTARAKSFDNVFVMYDFMEYINWQWEQFEGAIEGGRWPY